MNKIAYVALNRAEGPSEQCVAIVFHVENNRPEINDRHFKNARYVPVKQDKIASEVSHQIMLWGTSAPQKGGYDKVDFIVCWEGEENSYSGRFDMEYGGVESQLTFWESLKYRISVYALKIRPSHMSDDDWDYFSKRMSKNKDEAERMLEICEFPL